MYHVLVADDEPRHRRGIAEMIKMFRPDYRLFMAKDGVEALRIATDTRIDIMFTDIHMPNMDGLTLIEHLRERSESMKIVILSVYGHFDYARQALKLGAFDYLLKPLESKDIAEMLNKLDMAIEKERVRLQVGASLKEKLNSAIPVYEQHLLSRWLRSAANEDELREIEGLVPKKQAGFVWISKFSKSEVDKAYLAEEFAEVITSIKSWMLQVTEPVGPAITFYLEGDESMLVSVIAPSHSLEWLMKKDVERLSQFIEQVRLEFGLTLSIGVGDGVVDLYRQAPRSFKQALHALDYTFYCGSGKVVVNDGIAYNPYKPSLELVPADTGIAAAVMNRDREKAMEALSLLIRQLLDGDYPSPAHLKHSILFVLVNLVKVSEASLRSEEAGNFISEMEFQIPACATLDEIQKKADHYLNRIIDSIETRRNNKNERIITMCKAYLAEHYMEDLSLELVAKRFFFSAAYFSSFFRSHTSMTFTEYLLQIRMDKAKRMLEGGNRKISEIALSVGFRDAGYFTRIFKRETGLSPEEFRKKDLL
ncbi:AraC family two component transcriptional regulator [Fontibacillus phaseoli]|uniref:AraC family two component transcriptional regulator n=2 Tax=Fontibacillus phaseoli TaxID=1416533 RepID=A0A369BSU6_9BACL|nr:AraC family two component transcriptional regulator [Fontibacillus phaseoli]